MATRKHSYTISVLRSSWSPFMEVPEGVSILAYAQEFADRESVKEVSIYRDGRHMKTLEGKEDDA